MKHVRVENGQVVECLDYRPDRPGDWRNAIEVSPPLVPFKQIYGAHSFDISKDPVEIVWPVVDLTVDERRETIMNQQTAQLQMQIQQEMQKEFSPTPEQTNLGIVEVLMRQLREKKAAIAALATHEDIDAYIAANNIVP